MLVAPRVVNTTPLTQAAVAEGRTQMNTRFHVAGPLLVLVVAVVIAVAAPAAAQSFQRPHT